MRRRIKTALKMLKMRSWKSLIANTTRNAVGFFAVFMVTIPASAAPSPCVAEMEALKTQMLEEDREFRGLISLYDLASFEFEDLYFGYLELEGRDHTPLASGTFDGLSDLNQKMLGFLRLAEETADTLAVKRDERIAELETCLATISLNKTTLLP